MLVEEEENLARSDQAGRGEELAIFRIERVGQHPGIPHQMVHRHGAQARPVVGQREIARALVNPGVAAHVFAQFRFGDQQPVGVVRIGGPVLHAVDPVLLVDPGLLDSVIVHEPVVVVVGIKLPAQGELLHVADADRGLAFLLGFAQRGQEQTGEDRDDRDDHQQFDQREAALARI